MELSADPMGPQWIPTSCGIVQRLRRRTPPRGPEAAIPQPPLSPAITRRNNLPSTRMRLPQRRPRHRTAFASETSVASSRESLSTPLKWLPLVRASLFFLGVPVSPFLEFVLPFHPTYQSTISHLCLHSRIIACQSRDWNIGQPRPNSACFPATTRHTTSFPHTSFCGHDSHDGCRYSYDGGCNWVCRRVCRWLTTDTHLLLLLCWLCWPFGVLPTPCVPGSCPSVERGATGCGAGKPSWCCRGSFLYQIDDQYPCMRVSLREHGHI